MSEARHRLFERALRVHEVVTNGSPFSSLPDDFDDYAYVREQILAAPEGEVEVVRDVLLRPVEEREAAALRRGLPVGHVEYALEWYVAGWLSVEGARLADAVEVAVCDPRGKRVVLKALGLTASFPDDLSEALLPALDRAWRCAATEAELISVIAALSGYRTAPALVVLEAMLADETLAASPEAESIRQTHEFVAWFVERDGKDGG